MKITEEGPMAIPLASECSGAQGVCMKEGGSPVAYGFSCTCLKVFGSESTSWILQEQQETQFSC
ncbi:MAG: hypothetical protein WCR02_08300, partial [Sphaerochaetaceae bacterium]